MVAESFSSSYGNPDFDLNLEGYSNRVFLAFSELRGNEEMFGYGCSCVRVASLNKMVPGCNACKN